MLSLRLPPASLTSFEPLALLPPSPLSLDADSESNPFSRPATPLQEYNALTSTASSNLSTASSKSVPRCSPPSLSKTRAKKKPKRDKQSSSVVTINTATDSNASASTSTLSLEAPKPLQYHYEVHKAQDLVVLERPSEKHADGQATTAPATAVWDELNRLNHSTIVHLLSHIVVQDINRVTRYKVEASSKRLVNPLKRSGCKNHVSPQKHHHHHHLVPRVSIAQSPTQLAQDQTHSPALIQALRHRCLHDSSNLPLNDTRDTDNLVGSFTTDHKDCPISKCQVKKAALFDTLMTGEGGYKLGEVVNFPVCSGKTHHSMGSC